MSVTHPQGFRAAGVAAGLKASGDNDVAVLINDGPSQVVAAVWTSNRCKANPVLWSERAAHDGRASAVVVNSGGANCYTGPEGFQLTHATAELAGQALDVAALDVLVCSTGLIGILNDRHTLLAGVSKAISAASADGGADAASAIMTTDTVAKTALVQGDGWSVAGMAKGAGMLAPGLATMLVFLTTDADVQAAEADTTLRAATAITFDRLDSDGCMSTNDAVVLMASGASGVQPDSGRFAQGRSRSVPRSRAAAPARCRGVRARHRDHRTRRSRRDRCARGRQIGRAQQLVQMCHLRQGSQLGAHSCLGRDDRRDLRPAGSRRRSQRRLGMPQQRCR